MGISVKIDVSAIERIAGKLDSIGAVAMGQVTRRAVNETADKIYELSRPRMLAGLNLTDAYVKSRMVVHHAKPGGKAEAVITGKGGNNDMTQLVNYGATQLTQRVNQPQRKDLKGDALRNIPIGKKQRGVYVSVKPGSYKAIENGFLVTLKRGQVQGGNGFGLATRSRGAKGRDDYRIRYGPSVYQLFRRVAAGILDEARDELENNVVAYATELFEKELR